MTPTRRHVRRIPAHMQPTLRGYSQQASGGERQSWSNMRCASVFEEGIPMKEVIIATSEQPQHKSPHEAVPLMYSVKYAKEVGSEENVAKCHLLALPAELRNKIYDYALLQEERIFVTSSLTEPGLLKTCQKIREEARSMCYAANTFKIRIHDFHFTLERSWSRRVNAADICANDYKIMIHAIFQR